MIKFVINLERCLERMDYFDDSYTRWIATDYKDLDDGKDCLRLCPECSKRWKPKHRKEYQA